MLSLRVAARPNLPHLTSHPGTVVFHGSPVGSANYAVLCIGSEPLHAFFTRTLRHYQSRVVYDLEVAFRRARRASFDVYVAFDAYDPSRTVAAWRKIRRVDGNTPFILIGPNSIIADLQGELRSGYDALIDEAQDEALIVEVMEGLLLSASERSLRARRFAVARVCEEIEQRLAHLEQKIRLSRHSLAHAQENLVRADAMREFQRHGGAKAFFDRLWPDMFEEALQRSRLGV